MKTIHFEIKYLPNTQIHQNGYVEVPDDVEETPNWFYFDGTSMETSVEFTHHDGVELTQTEEQSAEIDRFLEVIHFNLVDFINDIILNADEDENWTYTKEDILLKINDGSSDIFLY